MFILENKTNGGGLDNDWDECAEEFEHPSLSSLQVKTEVCNIITDVISTCNIGKHFNDPRSWELSKSTPTKMVGIIMGFLWLKQLLLFRVSKITQTHIENIWYSHKELRPRSTFFYFNFHVAGSSKSAAASKFV